MMDRIGRERGWPPMTREQFEASRALRGANFVGSPEEVAERILFQHEIFGHERFLIQFSVGTLPHSGGHAVDRALRHAGRARGARRAGAPAGVTGGAGNRTTQTPDATQSPFRRVPV